MANRRSTPPLSAPVIGVPAEPDLAPEHKQAIVSALRWAWQELCSSHMTAAREDSEEVVTALIERLLNDRIDGKRRAPGIEDFETVTRGSKVRTADSRIEKQPDLHFRPPPYRNVRQSSDWAWFVECKLINGAASVEAYCVRGVQRFTSGEYGACMPTAALLAYVRDGQQPFDALNPKLPGRFGTVSHTPGPNRDLSQSRHLRNGLPQPCVDIELSHIWLQVAPVAGRRDAV